MRGLSSYSYTLTHPSSIRRGQERLTWWRMDVVRGGHGRLRIAVHDVPHAKPYLLAVGKRLSLPPAHSVPTLSYTRLHVPA